MKKFLLIGLVVTVGLIGLGVAFERTINGMGACYDASRLHITSDINEAYQQTLTHEVLCSRSGAQIQVLGACFAKIQSQTKLPPTLVEWVMRRFDPLFPMLSETTKRYQLNCGFDT